MWREKRQAMTRQMLLEAALEVFIQRGRAATMEDIARHAHCSPSLFYNFFHAKQALIETLAMQQLSALFELAIARMRATDASMSRLREGLHLIACFVAERRTLFRFLFQTAPVWREMGDGTAAHTNNTMQEFMALTSDLLEESQRAGLMRTDLPVSELQAFIHLVCLGLIERVATTPGEPHAEKLASFAWDLLYAGIGPPAPAACTSHHTSIT
jgi:AcrR family transcriptional regulator